LFPTPSPILVSFWTVHWNLLFHQI
jgi:hypothetical protein